MFPATEAGFFPYVFPSVVPYFFHQIVPISTFCSIDFSLVGGLVAIFYFPIYWVSNHPNWRSHIFQRGGPSTNQFRKCFHWCTYGNMHIYIYKHWGWNIFDFFLVVFSFSEVAISRLLVMNQPSENSTSLNVGQGPEPLGRLLFFNEARGNGKMVGIWYVSFFKYVLSIPNLWLYSYDQPKNGVFFFFWIAPKKSTESDT